MRRFKKRRRSPQASGKQVRKNVADMMRAPRRMKVSDAVAQYMRVPKGAANSVPWEPDVAPYVIEPMNCLASREYDAVIFVGPARTGKTIALIDGWIVYSIVCDPADMLVIQISEEKAREHSKKRLARTFNCSPEVKKRLSAKRNDNNVHDRTFKAGNYLKIGWPSVNIMSSSDYRFVALTDYDRMDENIDGEGDGFMLASKRTTTFMSSGKTLVESSPGRDVIDVKWRPQTPHEGPPCTGVMGLFNSGDRRRLYWPCPHCGEYFQPIMENMTGYRNSPDVTTASEAAYLQCPSCGEAIHAGMKRELNKKCVWLRDGETIDRHGKRGGTPRRSRIASFWMEGVAAAYQTWAQLYSKYLNAELEYEATQSEEKLKTVVNTDFGRPYIPRAKLEQRKSEVLEARAEPLEENFVPDGVRFLVATVDVQGGKNRRFVVQLVGYGERGERWIVARYEIKYSLRCDANGEALRINPASFPEDWDLLISDVFDRAWPLAADDTKAMRVMSMAVDSGGEDGVTNNAYAFWRRCRIDGIHRNIFLFKGDGLKRDKLIQETYPDNNGNSKRRAKASGDVPLYLLQTNALKDRVNGALWRETPGPGFVHFPAWLDSSFYDELTYEERSPDGHWKKPGRGANEAFDLLVYAEALAILKGYDKIKWPLAPKWAKPETWIDAVERYSPAASEENAPPPAEEPAQEAKPKKTPTAKPKPKRKPKAKKSAWSGGGGWL